MTTLYFKTADGGTVGRVRDVPDTGGGLRKARYAMKARRLIEIDEAEYARLKAEIDQRKAQEGKQ